MCIDAGYVYIYCHMFNRTVLTMAICVQDYSAASRPFPFRSSDHFQYVAHDWCCGMERAWLVRLVQDLDSVVLYAFL